MNAFLLILFFLSGFASLVYEVLWTRLFGLLLGNTTLAISCVLAAFFTGLALGGRYFGRRADLNPRPLRLFAGMEMAILLSGLVILLLRGPIEALFTWAHPWLVPHPLLYYLIRFVIAFMVMLPATFFMGGTLPVMSRAFIQSRQGGAGQLGRLYGINTLGGMAGCLATAFFFLRSFGFTAAYAAAIGIDIFIAGSAWLFARSSGESAINAPGRSRISLSAAERVILTAMALSGFIAMSYEVLWSRLLVFILTNATYSFSIMLAAFLASIALGGFAGGRWAERTANPRRLLGLLEIGAGLCAALAFLLLQYIPQLQHHFFMPTAMTSWWEWNGIRFLQAFLVTSLAGLFLGATFPAGFRALSDGPEQTGTKVGELYFYNTLGGVLGSLATGLLLIGWLGAAAAMLVMIVLNILLGAWLLSGRLLRQSLILAILALILAAAITRLTPPALLTRLYSISETEYPLVAMREGIEGTVTVHRHASGETGERRIDVDGLNVAGSSRMLRTLQLLQGHLPMMLHSDPHKVLQIGFGTGQTSWAALAHPISSFQLVEISPDVLSLSSEFFQDLNRDVMKDPRFQPLILDGKNQLRYTGERYDVIMNDANYAVATASASLFTRDHFMNGRRRLTPGGIFSTWMTTDLHPEDFRIVLKTFQSVFPHAVLWMAPNCINKQVVLMGSVDPLKIDWAKWQERWPQAAAGLESVDIRSPHDLFACLLLDEQGMARLSAGAAVNSDDHPVLEFSTRDVRARDLCAFQNLSAMLAEPADWRQYLRMDANRSGLEAGAMAQIERYARASRQMFQGMLQFYQGQTRRALSTMLNSSRQIPESRLASGFYEEVDRQTLRLVQTMNRAPAAIAPRLELIRHYIGLERYEEAAHLLRSLLRVDVQQPAAAYEMARIHFLQARIDSARIWIDRAVNEGGKSAGASFLSGRIAERENELDRALGEYRSALARDPGMHEAHARIGHILLQQGRYAEARQSLLASLQAAPAQGAVAMEMGDAFLFEEKPEQAAAWYRRARLLGQTGPHLYHNLGNALALLGIPGDAVECYRSALRQDPDNAELHYNLAGVLIRLDQDREAVQLLERAISLDPGQSDYFNNLAMLHRKRGDYAAALRIFDEGLRRHPASRLLLTNRQTTLEENTRRLK